MARAKNFCDFYKTISLTFYPRHLNGKGLRNICITENCPTLKCLCKLPEIQNVHKQLDTQVGIQMCSQLFNFYHSLSLKALRSLFHIMVVLTPVVLVSI